MLVRFKPQPDAMGFFYGDIVRDGELVLVNVLPPLSERLHWAGKVRSPNIIPDDTRWTVFIDGDEIGRVGSKADIDDLIASASTSGA